MPWKYQKCISCETVFTDKIEIDTCPICRGKNIVRDDTENVSDIQGDNKLEFVSDSQDVRPINDMYGTDYDSFFVEIGDGDFIRVYGMRGIVPYLDKSLEIIL